MNSAATVVKFFESSNKPSLVARFDSLGKVWEIGYGCTSYPNGNKVKQGETITLIQADTLLKWHMDNARKGVLKYVSVKLSENQLQALTSFVYNVGIGNFASSTMLKYINAKRFKDAANEFPKWTRAGKVTNVAGLVKRREAERKLFES